MNCYSQQLSKMVIKIIRNFLILRKVSQVKSSHIVTQTIIKYDAAGVINKVLLISDAQGSEQPYNILDQIILINNDAYKAYSLLHSKSDTTPILFRLYSFYFDLYTTGIVDYSFIKSAGFDSLQELSQVTLDILGPVTHYEHELDARFDANTSLVFSKFGLSLSLVIEYGETNNYFLRLTIDLINISRNLSNARSSKDVLKEIHRLQFMPKSSTIHSKARIVFPLFNITNDRLNIFSKIIRNYQLLQSIEISVIAIGRDLERSLSHFNDIDIITIEDNANSPLWQKESIFNLASGLYPLDEYFIFLDADSYPRDINLWEKKLTALINEKTHLFQVYATIESNNAGYEKHSLLYALKNKISDCYGHGLGWCISHQFLRAINFLNTSLIDGSNDTVFLHETGIIRSEFSSVINVSRSLNLDKTELRYIDETMIHEASHEQQYRNYANRQKLLEMITLANKDLFSFDAYGLQKRTHEESLYHFIRKWTIHEFRDYGDFYSNSLALNNYIKSGVIKASPSASIELQNKRIFLTTNDSLLSILEGTNQFNIYANLLNDKSGHLRIDFQIPFQENLDPNNVATISVSTEINGDCIDHAYFEIYDINDKVLIDHKSAILPFKSFASTGSVLLAFRKTFALNEFEQIRSVSLFLQLKRSGFTNLKYSIQEISTQAPDQGRNIVLRKNLSATSHLYSEQKISDIFTFIYRSQTTISVKNIPSHLYVHPFTTGLSFDIEQLICKEEFQFIRLSVVSKTSDTLTIPVDINDPANGYLKLMETQVLLLNPIKNINTFLIPKQSVDIFRITFGLESSEYRSFTIEDIFIEFIN